MKKQQNDQFEMVAVTLPADSMALIDKRQNKFFINFVNVYIVNF